MSKLHGSFDTADPNNYRDVLVGFHDCESRFQDLFWLP